MVVISDRNVRMVLSFKFPIPGRDIILYTNYFQENIKIRYIIPESNNTSIEKYDALRVEVIRWSQDDKRDKISIWEGTYRL